MNVTLELPEHLAEEVRRSGKDLPRVLEAGFRYWKAGPGFNSLADVLEKLAGLPTPEDVLALHASPELQERIGDLLEKSKEEGLSPDEQREWRQYEYTEHLVCLAKSKAAILIKQR
ncbi:MAG: hypothetical protein K2W96_05870 [Gemmataceae bacterium]|nr:hypothetical protein [Gemmataceae bacterium]